MLKCFNQGLYDAATMMLGIESEYLARKLIDNYSFFLDKHEPGVKITFDAALNSCQRKVSGEYSAYCNSLKNVKGKKDANNDPLYPELKSLSPRMDEAANNAFMNYLRLTRNELDHPSNMKMEPSETMWMIVSFLKYFEIQNGYMGFYVKNS